MKIGVLSDSHIPKRAKALPKVVLDAFGDVECIIHAGDITDIAVLRQMGELAPIIAVAGNGDSPEMHRYLGEKRIAALGNFHVGIVHGHGSGGKTVQRAMACFDNDDVDCIIFGHSHMPYCRCSDGLWLFNPGSPTDRRMNEHRSFGMIEIAESIKPSIVFFDDGGIICKQTTC